MNPGKQAHNFFTGLAVEVSGGLIRQQNHGAVYEGARDGRALLFATGELGGAMLDARSQAHTIERFAHVPWTFAARGISAGRRREARRFLRASCAQDRDAQDLKRFRWAPGR